jgi:hypothetical protein
MRRTVSCLEELEIFVLGIRNCEDRMGKVSFFEEVEMVRRVAGVKVVLIFDFLR